MTRNKIKSKVLEILNYRLGLQNEPISESDELTNDLGADSLDEVEIVLDCEREFDTNISDSEALEVTTVSDLINLIESKIK